MIIHVIYNILPSTHPSFCFRIYPKTSCNDVLDNVLHGKCIAHVTTWSLAVTVDCC